MTDKLKHAEDKLEQLTKGIMLFDEAFTECMWRCRPLNNCSEKCKYYDDCDGEFLKLSQILYELVEKVKR